MVGAVAVVVLFSARCASSLVVVLFSARCASSLVTLLSPAITSLINNFNHKLLLMPLDCCLIPESPFYLEGRGGLFEFIEQRLKENGHLVIVVAEGAGQEYIAAEVHAADKKDASGNKLLLDIGPWLSDKIKDHFTMSRKMAVNMKYIDPTYMIRAIPSNASDNIYCTLLAHGAVHGAMAGYTGFTVGPVNSKHAYIPIARVTEKQNKVKLTDRMWARLLASTNQPSFVASDQERGS